MLKLDEPLIFVDIFADPTDPDPMEIFKNIWNGEQLSQSVIQGKLVPKLALGPFLTLSARNEPNMQSYLFQAYICVYKEDIFFKSKPSWKKLHHTFIKNG